MAEEAASARVPVITFSPASCGNMDVIVAIGDTVMKLQPTCYVDPFPQMILWLEAIASGADSARWLVDEESRATQLVYVRSHELWFGPGLPAQLLFTLAWPEGEIRDARAVSISTPRFVKALYTAFRTYVEGPDYDPREWEFPEVPEEWGLVADDEDGSYDWPWDGKTLRKLTSELVERYIAENETAQATGPRQDPT